MKKKIKSSDLVKGKKYGKIRPSLLPIEAIEEVIKVLEFGAIKHTPNGWREEDYPYSMWIDAAERHFIELKKNENRALDSRLLHAAHIACNMLFLTYYQLKNIGKDDRWKK